MIRPVVRRNWRRHYVKWSSSGVRTYLRRAMFAATELGCMMEWHAATSIVCGKFLADYTELSKLLPKGLILSIQGVVKAASSTVPHSENVDMCLAPYAIIAYRLQSNSLTGCRYHNLW